MHYNLLGIHFSVHPLLLLLLIPALAIVLVPYFRLNKKYRKTRNRITSMVLRALVCLFAILTLAGIEYNYKISNEKNEIILLVDVSRTEEQSKEKRDSFVETVLNDSRYGGYKVGIVVFGFTQEYIVPLTRDLDSVYDTYSAYVDSIGAEDQPDVTGTDIASALSFTKDLFENPTNGKIVLITDGKETDNGALLNNTVATVAAMGIRIDSAYVSSAYEGADVQINGITYPDYHVNVDQNCTITVAVQAKEDVDDILLRLTYDTGKGTETLEQNVSLKAGAIKNVSFVCTFEEYGVHKVSAEAVTNDAMKENDKYYSCFFMEVFNKVLIIERYENSSEKLKEVLTEELFEVDVVNLLTSENIPQTVEALRAYDQVIMNNIADEDMPEGFDELLYSYVYEYGGGLFTVGGDDEKGESHAYSHTQDQTTLYRTMLPVEAIKYTPPIGVYILIDASGSMSASSESGLSAFELAKAGAKSCMAALSERDYIGVMGLSTTYENSLPLTKCTEQEKIITSIDKLESGGSTNFYASIQRAGTALANLDVARRHIMIISDGGNNGQGDYIALAESLYIQQGITVSVLGVNMSESSKAAMENLVGVGHGKLYDVRDGDKIVSLMRESLKAEVIDEKNAKPFQPVIYNPLSSVVDGLLDAVGASGNCMDVKLEGVYGTKIREGAELILTGEYNIPLYAQWKFGKGMVGSFMCDLNGVWSAEFMDDEKGKLFVHNVVSTLMPTEDIKINDVLVILKEDNYLNTLSVLTELKEGEYVTGKIVDHSADIGNELSLNSVSSESNTVFGYVTAALGADNNYSRCSFVLKKGGVYEIIFEKRGADGQIVLDAAGQPVTYSVYKSFSYSEEFNSFPKNTETECRALLENVSKSGRGALIVNNEDPVEIFENFTSDRIKTIDPKPTLMILSIILFLADIFVRKFKFKWPHEIIRDRKEKRKKSA